MRKFIITEAQERELARILREDVYTEPYPQTPSMKRANKPYCINPDKVLIVKKFLDKGFTPHDYERIGSNGLPEKIKIVSMNTSTGEPLKYMYIDQLHDLLVDKFQKMFSDTMERSLFMNQVMKDWLNGRIGMHGNLSVNRLLESVTAGEIDERAKEANVNPTDKQKEAGNYKMGHISIKGMPISIENPCGSKRTFKRSDGTIGSSEMKNHYGYFTNTTGNGKDGDAVDVFLGPDIENFENVYVVDQGIDGKFDESKVMLGFSSKEDAIDAYLSNYEKGWKGLKKITTVSLDVFKKWLYRDHKQRKPFSDYVAIQKKKLDESIINEEEYNEIHRVAKMFDRKGALEVAEELSSQGIDAYTDGNDVLICIEQDRFDPSYADRIINHSRNVAIEYAQTHPNFEYASVLREEISNLDDYQNFKDTNLNSRKASPFVEGWRQIKNGGKMNLQSETGELLSDRWFSWIGYMLYGYAIVRDGHKYNLINEKGEIVLTKWHDDIIEGDDRLSYIIVDGEGKNARQRTIRLRG